MRWLLSGGVSGPSGTSGGAAVAGPAGTGSGQEDICDAVQSLSHVRLLLGALRATLWEACGQVGGGGGVCFIEGY